MMISWWNRGETLTSKLRNSRRLFGELCQAAAALHSVFNFPVLCIIVFKLIGVVFSLFIMIYGFIKPQNQFVSVLRAGILVAFVRDFLTLLTVCHAADMPVVQVWCIQIFQKLYSTANFQYQIYRILGCRTSRENNWNNYERYP